MSKTALVTGASRGIGYEFSKVLAENGYDLVVVARDLDNLGRIKEEFEPRYKISVTLLPADLSVPGICEKIHGDLAAENITVDVLVNNAGFGRHELFKDHDWDSISRMVQVNILSLTQLTKLFLKDMLARNDGKIVNVASTAGFAPGPLMAVYYATKAYVLSLSEAIADELKDTGVSVTCLCPGQTATDFQKTANVHYVQFGTFTALGRPDEVARYGYRAMVNRQRVAVPGVINKLMIFIGRLCPRRLRAGFVRYMQQKRKKVQSGISS